MASFGSIFGGIKNKVAGLFGSGTPAPTPPTLGGQQPRQQQVFMPLLLVIVLIGTPLRIGVNTEEMVKHVVEMDVPIGQKMVIFGHEQSLDETNPLFIFDVI